MVEKKYIGKEYFINAFLQSETYKNNFSEKGLEALFDYCEEYEDATGEEINFDMVALCCEYSEYASAQEAMEQYQPDDMPTVDIEDEDGEGKDLVQINEEVEELALEWLEERTQVIPFDGGIIILDF